MERKSITTAQAAELLGVSAQTVQKWVDAGHLSAWRTVGGHRRIDADSVQRMLAMRQDPTPASTQPGGVRPEVLVVDDDAIASLVMKSLLEQLLPQVEVVAMTSGFAALMHIGRRLPSLLVTDINMPGLDGLEMLRQLREDPATREMPCLLVTAYGPASLDRFGPMPDQVPTLRKPVSQLELAGMLRQLGFEVAAPGG